MNPIAPPLPAAYMDTPILRPCTPAPDEIVTIRPKPPVAHAVDRGLHAVHHAVDVQVDAPVPLAGIEVAELHEAARAFLHDPGVVHQDVDRTDVRPPAGETPASTCVEVGDVEGAAATGVAARSLDRPWPALRHGQGTGR